jgi:hypothetical protein
MYTALLPYPTPLSIHHESTHPDGAPPLSHPSVEEEEGDEDFPSEFETREEFEDYLRERYCLLCCSFFNDRL